MICAGWNHGRAVIDYHRYRPRPMWVNQGSFGIPSQRTRASRHRLSPISTSPDVGSSRLIWHPIAHFAVSGRHSAEICKRPPPLLFGGRLQISAECPPSSLIGWGQAFSPPPHYLSATALSSAYQRIPNTHRGLRGVAPPVPLLLRLVCSSSGCSASSALPPAE